MEAGFEAKHVRAVPTAEDACSLALRVTRERQRESLTETWSATRVVFNPILKGTLTYTYGRLYMRSAPLCPAVAAIYHASTVLLDSETDVQAAASSPSSATLTASSASAASTATQTVSTSSKTFQLLSALISSASLPRQLAILVSPPPHLPLNSFIASTGKRFSLSALAMLAIITEVMEG